MESSDPVYNDLPFVCSTCGARTRTPDCATHPNAVVLDLRDDLTLIRLDEIDHRRWVVNQRRGIVVGLLAGLALVVVGVGLMPSLIEDGFEGVLWIAVGVALLGGYVGERFTKRRFTKATSALLDSGEINTPVQVERTHKRRRRRR